MNAPQQRPRWVRNLEADEAVWAAFRRRRALRAALDRLAQSLSQPIEDEEAAERADWLAAQQECGYIVEAHGHWSDAAR